jgi:hypothetical protein
MKTKFLSIMCITIVGSLLFSACKKDKPAEPNDEEVITTLSVKLTPVGGGATLEYKFEDLDGPGGTAPTIQDIILSPSTTYNAEVQVLDKTKTPAEDITEEVEEEDDTHRFYYEVQGGVNLTVNNLDNDENGVPLGISSMWATGAASNGKIQITLRHYGGNPPNKVASDPVDSDKSATDITTKDIGGFTVKVQ